MTVDHTFVNFDRFDLINVSMFSNNNTLSKFSLESFGRFYLGRVQ